MVDEIIAALVRQIQTQLVHIERVGPPAVQAFLESLRPKASATENLAAMPNESHPQAQCSIASGFFQFLGDGVCCLLDGLGCFGLIGHSRLRSVLVYHINWRLFSGLGRCAALPSGCGSVGGNQLVGFVHVISEIVNCEEPAHQHQDARSGASCHIHDLCEIGAFADPLHRIPTRQQTTPHEASSLAAGY